MKKRLFKIRYKFDPAPDGARYELKFVELKVKATSQKVAMEIGYKWLDNCWKFYRTTIRELKDTR